MTSQSLVYPCLFKSSTPTCMDLIIQYLSLLPAFEVCVLWSLCDLPTIIHNRGWESLCDVQSLVHPCLFKSSTTTCMDLIIQYLSLLPAFEVSEVLCVLRVEHLDYLDCEHLRTVSKNKLISSFCERPSDWGDRQFNSCTAFAKGPTFLNMVMTFFLILYLIITPLPSPMLNFCFSF